MFVCTICGCPIGGEGDLVSFHEEGGEELVCDDCSIYQNDCTRCGGSGGGEGPWRCLVCNGSGRFRISKREEDF